MFRTIASQVKGVLQRFLPVQEAIASNLVGQEAQPLVVPTVMVAPQPAIVHAREARYAASAGRTKRFRRTAEELALGLDQEQAKAFRSGTLAVATNLALVDDRQLNKPNEESKVGKTTGHGVEVATVTKSGVEIKAKRFRRTKEEINLGLTPEQAAERRGLTAPKRIFTTRPGQAQVTDRTDLISTLDKNIQVRARAVSLFRSRGGKGLITAEMLDKIQAAVAAGRVTKCPPCVDSDGYDHLAGKEVA